MQWQKREVIVRDHLGLLQSRAMLQEKMCPIGEKWASLLLCHSVISTVRPLDKQKKRI